MRKWGYAGLLLVLPLLFSAFSVFAQVPESPKLNCEYSALRMANFGKNTLRDEAALVLNNTVKMLSERGKTDHEICVSPIYVRARKLYERIAVEQAKSAADVKVKYSSKESSL